MEEPPPPPFTPPRLRVCCQALVHSTELRPGRLRRALRRWQQVCANRQEFRRWVAKRATVWGGARPSGVSSPPTSGSSEGGDASATAGAAGRASASLALRRWRRALLEREGRREAAGLATGFRRHLLLLRHHEGWKAAVKMGRAAAALEASSSSLARRARMRRALRGMASAAEARAEEREAARPRLREAFDAWEAFVRDRAAKAARKESIDEERRG